MAAKIVKTLILLAFATLFSTSASAQYGTHAYCNGVWLPIGVQCGSGGGVVNNGGVVVQQQQCPAGSAWDGRGCLVNNNQQQWQQTLANQVIRIPMGQQVPQGFCPLSDRFVEILKDMTFGAIVGGLVGDSRESARAGAGIGAVAGVFVPCNTLQQYQQVVVQQQQVQQNVVQQQNSGPVCVFPTRDHSGLSEAECSQLGGVYKNGQVFVGQQRVQQQMVLNHQIVERRTERRVIPTCKVISDEAIYRFNAVNGVKIGPSECAQYVKGEIPLPSELAMSIIP